MSEQLDNTAKVVYVITEGIIRIKLCGPITSTQVIEAREAFLNDNEYVQGMPSLYDLRSASMALINSEELHRILTHGVAVADRRGYHRTAILAPADISFGVSRMYEAIGERPDLDLRVFREEEAALDWLRSDSPTAE